MSDQNLQGVLYSEVRSMQLRTAEPVPFSAGFYNPFWILPVLWVFELFGDHRLALGSWHYLKLDWVTRELIGFEVGDSRLATLGFSFKVRVNAG